MQVASSVEQLVPTQVMQAWLGEMPIAHVSAHPSFASTSQAPCEPFAPHVHVRTAVRACADAPGHTSSLLGSGEAVR